jgi:hypothetical protein
MISPSTDLVLQALARDAAHAPDRFCEALYRLADLLAEQSGNLVKHSNAAGIAGHAMRSTAVGYAAWADRLGPELPFEPEQEAA